MSSSKTYQYDPNTWDDQEDPETYQPLRKQTGKAATVKDARRQQSKEWGRSMHKYFKQRAKTGKP